MLTRARPGLDDDGETLLELMIAVAIMGIVVVAIVGGIATSILVSDIHRKQATAGAYVRSYSETVVAYVAAGTPASNANFAGASTPDYRPSTVGFTAPAGFVASVKSVWCWDDASKEFISSCAAPSAVQQVTVNIASSDSRASETLRVIVRKP